MMVLIAAIGGFGLAGVGYQLIPLTRHRPTWRRCLDASIFASICAVFSVRGLGMRLPQASASSAPPRWSRRSSSATSPR